MCAPRARRTQRAQGAGARVGRAVFARLRTRWSGRQHHRLTRPTQSRLGHDNSNERRPTRSCPRPTRIKPFGHNPHDQRFRVPLTTTQPDCCEATSGRITARRCSSPSWSAANPTHTWFHASSARRKTQTIRDQTSAQTPRFAVICAPAFVGQWHRRRLTSLPHFRQQELEHHLIRGDGDVTPNGKHSVAMVDS